MSEKIEALKKLRKNNASKNVTCTSVLKKKNCYYTKSEK